MNKYENILVDTVGRIKESFGGEALRNGKRLQGLCMDMSPQLMNQREYKMLVILIKCGGNEALLDALNDTPAVQERAVARLTQRMADEYVMDETAARRICALYMTAASGNSAYIDRLDAAEEAKRQPAPKPAPAPTPKSAPAAPSTPKTAPSSTPKPAPAPTPTPKPAPKPAPAPATEPKAQKTPDTPRLKLKKRHLRFVPMAIAMLGGYFVLGPVLVNTDPELMIFTAADITRMKVFCAVYLLAAIYCYIIAFPFDELFKYRRGWFGRVKAVIGNLFGDIWMAVVSMPMGVVFALANGSVDVEGGIWGWLKAIGFMLIFVFFIGLMLAMGFSAHASPKKEEAEMPEFADWAKENGNAVKVMYAAACAMFLCAVVKALIVG